MKIIFAIVPILFLYYMSTFAAHNWRRRNKLAAVGIVLIALSAAVLPIILIFLG
ncbi:MAG: hypothetical protein GX193_08465 [Clostridiales bacterium]|nr:hypothetical protein [Clostridiales bacterium]